MARFQGGMAAKTSGSRGVGKKIPLFGGRLGHFALG